MSGQGAPKPQAPKVFKPGKFSLTFVKGPKPQEPQDAELTVLPSSEKPKAEDKGAAPRYEGIVQRRGMFEAVSQPAAVVSGKPVVEKRRLTAAERLARPLAEDENENEDEDEAQVRAEAASLPSLAPVAAPPPPVAAPPPVAPVAAPPPPVPVARTTAAIPPSILQQMIGKPVKKLYTEAAVKKRVTVEIAETLVDLGKQLQELKPTGLDIAEGKGLVVGPPDAEGRKIYTFSNPLRETPFVSEVKLQALDDLFPSLRIRMKNVVGKGSLRANSVDPIAIDFAMLVKLITYAETYIKDKPKAQQKEKLLAIRDMFTDEIVNTLVELKETFNTINISDMEMQFPAGPDEPTIYELESNKTFLAVDDTPESKENAEKRLAELTQLFPGKTQITLTSIKGMGEADTEGTPLYNDLQLLQSIFPMASEYKKRQDARKKGILELQEKTVGSLEGTEYEEIAKPIQDEMKKSPYEVTTDSEYVPGKYKDSKGTERTLPKQKGFVAPTRRAFGYFIYDKYRRYMLKAMEKLDPNACSILSDSSQTTQIYAYQKFVRDYISFMTPYRGVLVYHGLGSGKTCTAIAASEALLSSGGKRRIIVMTPFSLRKNFIQQITFCGFRHFRLLNYWTPHTYTPSDGKNALWLFATTVLNIPESYLSRKRKTTRIWIPDLTKPQSEENYSRLSGGDQAEIRNQINETLIYDPYKGKQGLIWFINYNGITASKLLDLACKVPSNAFDDSVIVIDEIHNLIRLMQGSIDPYLKKLFLREQEADRKRDPKYLDPERITSGKWRPKYCGKSMGYQRGYLFYRLLVEAKNTKIVGLSGTPLINFPEELGILANILHGYNYVYTVTIPKSSEAMGTTRIQEGLEQMAEGVNPSNFHPDVDFYQVTIDDIRATITFTFTFLPEGYRKIQGQLGVERISVSQAPPSTSQKLETMKVCIRKVIQGIKGIPEGYPITFTETSEPLLPVMGEPSIPDAKNLDDSFKGRFVAPNGESIVNEQILLKRLSGLISYYKGSRKDLMPEVASDTIVRVPMSLEQQQKYIGIRLAEIKIEEQKEKARKKGRVDVAGLKSDDAELKKLSSSQNYRMASRQACNFTFPDGITRPRPLTAEQAKQSDEFGGSLDELLGEEQVAEDSALVGTKEEEREAKEEDERMAQEARDEDERIHRQQEEEEIKETRERMKAAGTSDAEVDEKISEIKERYESERVGEIVLAAAVPELQEELSQALTSEQKRCLANMMPNESYQAAIQRSKECLLKYGLQKLALIDYDDPTRPSPLGKWSAKYKAILEKIESLPGSSLVYSQFLGMEGIGIFTIAMQANGYEPIRIVSSGGQYMFDEKTEESLRKGPKSGIPRFILFTGGEVEEIRKINIDLFNAKFGELPPRLKDVLEVSGFTDAIGNKKGELCRVFCITAAGAEGLSLKNVRGVHIMEPYWNDVRMAQVKGRAVRICSHQELPLQERTVKIFTYISVFGELAQESPTNIMGEKQKWAIPQQIWLRDSLDEATAKKYGFPIKNKREYAMTSDERLYLISEKKKKLVENLIVVMKTAAADCLLNYKENRDGTFICRLLGNEGDFLYHPNLQKDIETSKNDDIGDLFTVPVEEKKRIQEADAKLVFEEKAALDASAMPEEAAPQARAEEVGAAAPSMPAEAAAPSRPAAQPKRISYPVKIAGKEYSVSAVPDSTGKVANFLIYASDDKTFTKPLGTAEAQYDATKKRWLPKAGTVVLKAPV